MDEHPDYVRKVLGKGLIQLIGGDYIRPSTGWLMATSSPVRIANEMAKVRDPHGIAELRAVRMAQHGRRRDHAAGDREGRADHGLEGRRRFATSPSVTASR